jgi:hypothetical protein
MHTYLLPHDPPFSLLSLILPPRVQNIVTLVAVEMHNSLEKQDSIHRDAICSRLSLNISRVWRVLCLSTVST